MNFQVHRGKHGTSGAGHFVSLCLLLLLLLGTVTSVKELKCITNPDWPCQCTFPDGTIFDSGIISKASLFTVVHLEGNDGEVFDFTPCENSKYNCPIGEELPANVSICNAVVASGDPPIVDTIVVAMAHKVTYTVIDENPKNFKIVAHYAPVKEFDAQGSNVTFIYDEKQTTANMTCTNCHTTSIQFNPQFIVRSNKVTRFKPRDFREEEL